MAFPQEALDPTEGIGIDKLRLTFDFQDSMNPCRCFPKSPIVRTGMQSPHTHVHSEDPHKHICAARRFSAARQDDVTSAKAVPWPGIGMLPLWIKVMCLFL